MKFQSAEMYIEMGKFGIPAKHHEAISVIYSKVDPSLLSVLTSDLCLHFRTSSLWTRPLSSTTSASRLIITIVTTETLPGQDRYYGENMKMEEVIIMLDAR